MTRADVYLLQLTPTPRAILLLCPGMNGNGEEWIRKKEWQQFAREENLALAGLSFASPDRLLSDHARGYYYASKGSGQVLLDALQNACCRELPLLLYGFSGGAHFTSRFVEWRPERVIAWCAYSAGWWDPPQKARITPPGIVACGDADPRFGATISYFKQGRAAGKPWLWIGLANVGHNTSPQLEAFVREYFRLRLDSPNAQGLWMDVDRNTPANEDLRAQWPCLTGWLPEEGLFASWRSLNQP